MADPVKKTTKTATKPVSKEPIEEEYELLPHKEIIELREELRKVRSLPSGAGKHAEIAEGIVALADIMNEIKDKLEVGVIYKAKEAEVHTRPIPTPPRAAPMPPMGAPRPQGPMPPPGAPMPGPMPAPPAQKKRGLFGRK